MSKISSSVENIYDSCGCLLGTLLIILCIVLALGIVFGVFCFEGWIFMLLWNWLIVDVFALYAPLGYWVCVGICFALNFLWKLTFGRIRVSTGDD